MGPADPTCWYCLAAVPVETVAERPACERCAKAMADGQLSPGEHRLVVHLAPVQTAAHEEAV